MNYRGSARPGGGSVHTPFAAKDIPVIFYITGLHPDYHTPVDHVEKVDWDKMLDVTRLSYLNIWEIVNDSNSLLENN